MTRRYLFIFYPDLLHLDIERLGKVADRIFLLVAENVVAIPLATVIRLKKLKKSLKWVITESDTLEARQMQLSFMLGKMHEKVASDIEFAIVTDDLEYDFLIQFVNRSHRKCLRVHLGQDECLDEEKCLSEIVQPKQQEAPRVVVHRHPHVRAYSNTPPAPEPAASALAVKEHGTVQNTAAQVQYG